MITTIAMILVGASVLVMAAFGLNVRREWRVLHRTPNGYLFEVSRHSTRALAEMALIAHRHDFAELHQGPVGELFVAHADEVPK